MAKIYSVQPRFKTGDIPGGWQLIDGVLKLGTTGDVPAYGSAVRDSWLSMMWANEPMIAGAFSTWVEKAQTVNWKVIGGRNKARFYANLLHGADLGRGWTYHEGMCALDYLVCDKGQFEELGRQRKNATTGRVMGLQHIDSTRIVKMGNYGQYWRYFPETGKPVDLKDENIIQINSMPQGRDRFRGLGYCAMSRLLDAKQLMLGYLTYYRQEVGDLPPELVVILNGISGTAVRDSLNKYKMDREQAGHGIYPKVWWLGSDNPSNKVEMTIHNLTSPNKSFNYQTMIEWWIKIIALNTGEDVGEFWLVQHAGATKALQSIQHMKAKGKGVANYLQEKERRYNMDIMPFGVRFEYDNTDDEQDRNRADILATNLGNLDKMARMGLERMDFVFTMEEIRQMAIDWAIIPEDMEQQEVPHVIGSMLKEASTETWVVDRHWREYKREPILRGKDARIASTLGDIFDNYYGRKVHKHKRMDKVVL